MQIRNKSEINQKKILYSFQQENLLLCVFFSCFIGRNDSRNAPGSIPYFIYFNCYNLICCHMLEKAFLNLLKLFSLIMSLFIFSQYFFQQILPSGQCGVTPHYLYRHSITLDSGFRFFIIINLFIGDVVQLLSLPHSLIQLSLNSGSAQVQTLLAACRRFAMVRISDNVPGWK